MTFISKSQRVGEQQTIDMLGAVVAHHTVLRRAPSCGTGARWWVRCECGHEQAVTGGMLRKALRLKGMLVCKSCRRGQPKNLQNQSSRPKLAEPNAAKGDRK